MQDDFLGSVDAGGLLSALEGVAYITDADGLIRLLSVAAWSRFAEENDAPELNPNRILGRSIFEMIAGEKVRDSYRAMHQAVVSGERPRAVFNFRCDSPEEERWMRMSIGLLRGDRNIGVLYQSQLVRAELRPSIALFSRELIMGELRAGATRPIITMCSYCQRVAAEPSHEDGWIEAADYYARGGSSNVRISHGICGQCMVAVVNANTSGATLSESLSQRQPGKT